MDQHTIEVIKRSPAAERMRVHRDRKRSGMRCVIGQKFNDPAEVPTSSVGAA
jgi:hypothetical protein